MAEPFGRTFPLSLPRRLICDLLHFAQRVPTIPVQRHMNLADVATARRLSKHRPSWCSIFTKAYGKVAAAEPALRRCYLSFPRPKLYEHPNNIASVAIARRFEDEDAVFFAHLRNPEQCRLWQIDSFLDYHKTEPIEAIALFRRALRVTRLPLPLRRFLWWYGLELSGQRRATMMGTFGVSVYSGTGSESLHPLSLLTTTLNYGVIKETGDVDVRIIYDHRVLDGVTISRALARLEEVLHSEILDELQPAKNGVSTNGHMNGDHAVHAMPNGESAQPTSIPFPVNPTITVSTQQPGR